jgi:hypothetical protein
MASLGHIHAWSRRRAEGVSWLEGAVTAYDSAGIGVYHSLSVERLGEAYLLADRPEEAHAAGERALALARGRGERACEAWALRLLADVASHGASPDLTAAVGRYEAAMTLASDLGMRPLVAHCHGGLGRLYSRAGWRAPDGRGGDVRREGDDVLAGAARGGPNLRRLRRQRYAPSTSTTLPFAVRRRSAFSGR